MVRTLKELNDFKTAQNCKRYPNLPKSAVAKGGFKDSNANELTKAILYHFEEVLGGLAFRVNNTGIYDPRAKRFRSSHTRKGIPDIIAVLHSVFIGIEVKYGKDRMSPHQKQMQKDIEAAGGLYFVAKTFEQYTNTLHQLLNEND
jgi:hypothetical protein